jgi:phosphate-selective porin OprO/OprP
VSLQRSVEGVFDLLDANLDIRFREQFQLRLGRTLIPYSYTWYDHLEQYFIVPERPLFPLNFGLARTSGVQIWGNDPYRRWQYSVGLYDGRAAGLADNSTTTDAVSYLNVRPFAQRCCGGILENFNIGGSVVLGKFRRPTELLPLRTSIQSSENDEAATSASAVFLEYNPNVVGLGDRLVGAVHAAWYYGPFSMETEWNAGQLEHLNEGNDEVVDVQTDGFHVTFASFVTGETVRGREVVQPLRPFDPRCGFRNLGALEPFVRYSYLKLGDEVFDEGLANPDEWTNEVSMTDVGINWYLNRYVKFYFDWQHAAYATPVLVNEETGKVSNSNDLYWIRCQFYF